MSDIRGGTQVLFLYRIHRLTPDGTENIVYYVGDSVQQVKRAAERVNDDHILTVRTLYPVQIVLKAVQ